MANTYNIRRFKDAADYTKNFVIQDEIDRYLPGGKHFIDEDLINRTLAEADSQEVDPVRIREIIAKAESTCETLEIAETAALMRVTDKDLFEEMRAAADRIKHKVYDNRIVMFAPLYMSNLCVNGCRYCGFREGNELQKRRVLTMDELKEEVHLGLLDPCYLRAGGYRRSADGHRSHCPGSGFNAFCVFLRFKRAEGRP